MSVMKLFVFFCIIYCSMILKLYSHTHTYTHASSNLELLSIVSLILFCIRAFDTELVVIAEKLNVSLAEVGVVWHEVEGSKLDVDKITLALVSLGMLRDMVCVRACYLLEVWKLKR